MNSKDKSELLTKAKSWFNEVITINHIKNSKKLINISEFDVNPFLATYLANFLTGNSDPISISKALIYPRVLGTSISTSFGTNIQKFAKDVLTAYASTTPGIDLEFTDCIDNNHKYCQLKAGPNTINKDDVETIAGHFKSTINLARTNGKRISYDDLIIGIIYGSEDEINGHYKRITSQYNYPVFAGSNFWIRLTGDKHFYFDLIKAISEVAVESDFSKELESIIEKLATSSKIIELSKNL